MKKGFGIVRENNVSLKEEDGNFILSVDGIKCYMVPSELADLIKVIDKIKE